MNGHLGATGALVVAREIRKSYSSVKALAPLSLTIGQGEKVALAGPSGSGKTTLSIPAGWDHPAR